jgi:regulator of PEP synthase PpsR (kinase-PPPase family)
MARAITEGAIVGGPIITAICSATRSTLWRASRGLPATGEPGALPVLDASYFKRVEAIECAVQADDG